VNQKCENDARDIILNGIFNDSSVLQHVLGDHSVGVSVITRIIAGVINANERKKLKESIQTVLEQLSVNYRVSSVYKRLLDELNQTFATNSKSVISEDMVKDYFLTPFPSPTRTAPSAEEPLPPRYPYAPDHYRQNDTPNQSPQYSNPYLNPYSTMYSYSPQQYYPDGVGYEFNGPGYVYQNGTEDCYNGNRGFK
jgi:hypothetical protein